MTTPLGSVGRRDPTPPTVAITAPAEQRAGQRHRHRHRGRRATTSASPACSSTSTASRPAPRTRARPTGSSGTPAPVANGAHTLTARARDAAGNSTTVRRRSPSTSPTRTSSRTRSSPPASTCRRASSSCPTAGCSSSSWQGRIRVLPPPYTQPDPTPFLQLTNIGSAGVQQGIYDIALDPNFATNHFYYVFYTLGSPNRDRLSRFTANATNTGTVAGSELVLYQDPAGRQRRAPRRRDQLRQRRQALLHDRRALQRRRRAVADEPAREDPPHQHGRHDPDRQPVLRRRGPERRLDLGLRAAQPVPRLLRRADRAALHRRRRRQRLLDGEGGGRTSAAAAPTTAGRTARATCTGPCTSPIYSYPHNGRDACDHRRLRLPRHAVPGRVPGQLLLRRLHAELDPAPDLRRQRQRHRRLQLRAGRRLGRRAVRRHRLPHGRARTARSTTSTSATRTSAARSASARSAASATSSRTSRRSRSPRPTRRPGRRRSTVSFSSAGSSDPEGQPLTYSWTFGDGAHVDRRQPDPHLHAGRASTPRG